MIQILIFFIFSVLAFSQHVVYQPISGAYRVANRIDNPDGPGPATITMSTDHGYITGQKKELPDTQRPCKNFHEFGAVEITVTGPRTFTTRRRDNAGNFTIPVRCESWPGAGSSHTQFQVKVKATGQIYEVKGDIHQLGNGWRTGDFQIPAGTPIEVTSAIKLYNVNNNNEPLLCTNLDARTDLIAANRSGNADFYPSFVGATGTDDQKVASCSANTRQFWREIRVYDTVEKSISNKLIPDAMINRAAACITNGNCPITSQWIIERNYARTQAASFVAATNKKKWLVDWKTPGGEDESLFAILATDWRLHGNTTSRTAVIDYLTNLTSICASPGYFVATTQSSGGRASSEIGDFCKQKWGSYVAYAYSLMYPELTVPQRQLIADQMLNAPKFGNTTNAIKVYGTANFSNSTFTTLDGQDFTTIANVGDYILWETDLAPDITTYFVGPVNEAYITGVTSSTISIAGTEYARYPRTSETNPRIAIMKPWTTGMIGTLEHTSNGQGSKYLEESTANQGVLASEYDVASNLPATTLAQYLSVGHAFVEDVRGKMNLEMAMVTFVNGVGPVYAQSQHRLNPLFSKSYYDLRMYYIQEPTASLCSVGVNLWPNNTWFNNEALDVYTMYPGEPFRSFRVSGVTPQNHYDIQNKQSLFLREWMIRECGGSTTANEMMRTVLYGDNFKDLDAFPSRIGTDASPASGFMAFIMGLPEGSQLDINTQPLSKTIGGPGIITQVFAARTGWGSNEVATQLTAQQNGFDKLWEGGLGMGVGSYRSVYNRFPLTGTGAANIVNPVTCEIGITSCYDGYNGNLAIVGTGIPNKQFVNAPLLGKANFATGGYSHWRTGDYYNGNPELYRQIMAIGMGPDKYNVVIDSISGVNTTFGVRMDHYNAGGAGQGAQTAFADYKMASQNSVGTAGIISTVLNLNTTGSLRMYKPEPSTRNGTAEVCIGTTTCENTTNAFLMRVDSIGGSTNRTINPTRSTTTGGWLGYEIDSKLVVVSNTGAPNSDGSATTTGATKVIATNIAPGVYNVFLNDVLIGPKTVPIGDGAMEMDGSGPGTYRWTASQLFVLTIGTTSVPNSEVGVAFNQAIDVTGIQGTATMTLDSGTLPPGITINGLNLTASALTAAGTYTYTLRVTDSANTAVRTYTSTVVPRVLLSPLSSYSCMANATFNSNVAASAGTSPYIFGKISGVSSIIVETDGDITGTCPSSAGNYPIGLIVTSSTGGSNTGNINLQVTGPLGWKSQKTWSNGAVWIANGINCQINLFADSNLTQPIGNISTGNTLEITTLSPGSSYWWTATCDGLASGQGTFTTPVLSVTPREDKLILRVVGTVRIYEGVNRSGLATRDVVCNGICEIPVTAANSNSRIYFYEVVNKTGRSNGRWF